MTAQELADLRRRASLSQSEMAERMGLSLRAYSDLETGEGELRRRHANSAEYVSLCLAVERHQMPLATEHVRDLAQKLGSLVSYASYLRVTEAEGQMLADMVDRFLAQRGAMKVPEAEPRRKRA